jgi:hypothetical protein
MHRLFMVITLDRLTGRLYKPRVWSTPCFKMSLVTVSAVVSDTASIITAYGLTEGDISVTRTQTEGQYLVSPSS